MMGSGSQTSWSSFFRSGAASNSGSNATASSSRTRIEDTLLDDMQPYFESSQVPSSSSASATRSGNPSPQDVRQSSSVNSLDATAAGDGRLHVLTERKLEKAALGKAVGLRQLVLLSNAFASRLSSGAASPSSRDAVYDQDASYGAADLEDALDRKKREEDWLDSVLDEMLTDEEDDEVPASPRDRTLYEPYVHVSINQRLAANSQWQSSDLIMPHLYHSSNFEPIADIVSDSGFLEPARIPLPISPEGSPSNSASSQSSDDGKSAASADESIENHHEQEDVADEEELTSRCYQAHAPSPIPIESPSRSYYGAQSMAGPPTPDLAYSVNSFFSNLSSSPPTSIHLPTPASSPPVDFASRKFYGLEDDQARVDPQDSELALGSYDSILPMEGLDLEDSERDGEEEESTSSSSGKSDETQKNDKPLMGIGSSLELVKYVPSVQGPQLDEAFRIPETSKRGGIFSFGSILSDKIATSHPPALPSPLLSTLLGRSSPASYSTRQSSIDKAVSARKEAAAKVTLPIVLPYEVVKSLYDSVDFGVPSSPLHGIKSPPAKSTDLATPLFNKARRSMSPPPRAAQASPTRSCPTSPRSRSKSLTNKADGIEHDSSGSLLFSSLGLYSRLASSPTRNWNHPNLARGDDHFIVDSSALFGREIVNEWERQRSAQPGQSRADSRSPSRLRSHLRPEDTEGDFDFGSV